MNLKMLSADSSSKITILQQKIFRGSIISTISFQELEVAILISISTPYTN